MALLVEDAARLWKDIPTESIHGAMESAIIEAGSFTATNGLVAKLWKDRKPKEAAADHAALGNRFKDEEKRFLEAPGARPPTLEEQKQNAETFAEISRRLRLA